ncbi:APC family permease [Streptomyces adelaidensis]|uniref:APC family permease n=1 Tax=Streptomyces adelaidensis TaxID=2796465 RepID=UPI0019051709|nr:APC family permease [Streptomyces adelaidensis]
MATSDEWSRVGFSGNPVTGAPGVMDGVTKELRELSDLAGRVSGGLDTLLAKAEDGGFEGRTADALRKYVKEELKTFMANVNRSFDMAATATARYARALGDARDRAENAADTVAALERVGGQPLAEDDPELTRARGEVDAEVDTIQAEAKILEETLREASRLVSRPVKKPKQSFWKKFVSTFFKVLEIVTLVLTLLAAVVTGPLGLIAFGLGAVLFAKALVDYAMGNGNALSLGLAFLGILFPSTKGLTTLGGLTRMMSSGAKALSGALSASGRLLFRGGRALFSPRALLTLTGQGLARLGGGLGGLGGRALSGLSALPRVFSKAPGALASTLRYMGGFTRSTWQRGWSAVSRDFAQSTAFIGGNTALRLGVFSIMSLGRLTMSALLPLRYGEIAQLGYRSAFRMGFVERGLHWSSRSVSPLTRTGALGGDLADLTGRGLDPTAALRPAGDTTTGKLAVPGTPEFNDTLDELADLTVRRTMAPGAPGFSSLPGPDPIRFPGRLDELGGRLSTLDSLDTVGLPVGTVPFGDRLGLIPLLPSRSTVDQLRDLDALTGLERTGAGLLKPLDDLADLAPLSFDGKLGGLTEVQVRQVLDGEIDLVNVTPQSVVLRVGKTDPVDVRVQLKDGVTVEVLGPADTRVPTLTATTGPDRLDDLGLKLDDLVRLIPDTTDASRTARELLGLGPVRTDLVTAPVTTNPALPPLTLREIVTGGATGKLATDRFQTWLRTQSAQFQLDTAGSRLTELTGRTDIPPLSRAQAELDLNGARLDFNRARIQFDRLGMNLNTVQRDITVMMTRLDGPAANLPTGELRLLDDLGRPTGQWITMEPGQSVNWVLRTDSGIVPDVEVRMGDGVFTVTGTDGLVTRISPDGRTVLADIPVRLESPAGPSAVPQGVDPVRVPVTPEVATPSAPQIHWLVRQDMDFSAVAGKSGMKTRLTADGLVPVKIDGTITPLQAVSTANAKVFKEKGQFTAFSPPGSIGKPFGDSEIGLDLVSLSNDIDAGAQSVRDVRILSSTQVQQEILKEIRLTVGDSTLEIPSRFTFTTKNDEIKKFLAENGVPKRSAASVTSDIKTLLQVRRDNTWLVQGAIPKQYLTGPYPTTDSLKFVPHAPATITPTTAPVDMLESSGRASGSGLPPLETPRLELKTDDFFMSNVDLERLRGVKLVRQDDFHALEVDTKGLRKSHFDPEIGMVPANPDGRTTAFQHVAGAENAIRKSNSPFTSFAVFGGEKVYGNTEFTLDVFKLGTDIRAGKLQNAGILPAWDLQQLISDQIERNLGKRLDFSGLTGNSSRKDVLAFLRNNDAVGQGGKDATAKIARDVRVLLNTTRDQEWLIKGIIPKSYLEGPYPRATGSGVAGGTVPVGDALHGLDEAAGKLRLSDTFKTDFEVKDVSVEWRTPAGTNSGRLPEPQVGAPDGAVTRVGTDGPPTDLGPLSDEFRLDRFDAPTPRSETVLLDPQQVTGAPGIRLEWQRTPLDHGGAMLTDELGDVRLVFTADEVLQFRDLRFPGADGFLRFEAEPGPGSLPRVVGTDGLPLSDGTVIEPVRGALGMVTGVRVQSPDGAWIGRFDLDGTRLSEQVTLSGLTDSPLTGARLTTTFTQLPGGGVVPSSRLTVPRAGEGAFTVVRLEGDLAQRLPGGFAVTDTATGTRFVFDQGGRFVDLPTDGATPIRLDASGTVVPETTVGPLTTLDGLGELNGLGGLERLTITDLPSPNLTPERAGFDARFDGMPLSGADELTNLRLRITELPAAGTTPASFRIDVVDFGAPSGPVRLPEVTVTVREGGGLSIAGPEGGVRWQFDALGHLQHRELPLNGTDLSLRFTDDALNPMPQVVGPDGVPVPGSAVTPLKDASGVLGELTVRVPVPGTDGLTAVWRFEPGGLLRQQEMPLTLPGLDGPAGLGIKVTLTPGAGSTTTRVFELTGPSHLTGSFRLTPADGSLAGRLPGGFTVTDTVTGSRFHFDATGTLAVRDLPDPDGSGFLRFTEDAAPGTPPVRLDDLGDTGLAPDDVTRIFSRTLDEAAGVRSPLDELNRLTGPDSPRTDALPEFGDLDMEQRTVVEDLWSRLGPDGQPLSTDELNRVLGPDSPRTDSLSELSDLSDLDLEALQARLDDLRHPGRELRHAPDGPLSRVDDPAALTRPGPGGGPLSPDELNVPLSGVDDLADFDLRVTRLPETDTTPPGSYRLELADRTPGGTGPVRASDFTVEMLDDSGRFAVVDPTGTTRFTFGPEGDFLGRETALAFDGLPEGLRLQVTIAPGADGTVRVMGDVLGPSGATASVRLTPMSGSLAGRLPGGFTLTDTVTGSRFHFDHTGRLALRDLADPDGSGFLRFTEDAAPGTPPVRLDELGDFGGDLSERFPLGSVPEEGVPDDVLGDALNGIDLARIFDRTLDEASGLGPRTLPEGAPGDLSGIQRAMDFLDPDPAALPSLDLPGVQRFAGDAAESLNRFGLRPELLNDQLRTLTGQAREALRQEAVTTLGRYFDLPLATRLDDLRSVAQGGTGRVIGDFTITPAPHGGPGGSRYTVHHDPSDVTLGFGPNRELRYQEVFLRGGPGDLDGLKVGLTGRSAEGGPWTPDALDFVGTRTADGFTPAPGTDPRGGFTLTDAAGTTSWHYGAEGVVALRDLRLPADRGVLRFDADTPGGAPRVLDSAGREFPGLRAEVLDDGRIALVPTGKGAHPLERTVFDPAGTLLEETIAIRGKGSTLTGDFWKIDHVSGTAVRTDPSGTSLTGRFDIAKVERSGTGQFRLTGADPGKVTLFERETLRNGNVLHLSRDRFGQARWTEFNSAGDTFRSGRRIGDADMRTLHDVPSGSWRRLLDNAGDVRTYTKGSDGGLVRAEKGPGGEWSWQRFGKDGAESLSGTRHWNLDHVGFRDTFLDPATGTATVAQRRGSVWPFSGLHGSRMYQEFSVVPGHAPAGGRIDAGAYTGHGLANAQIESLETLTDGGSLLVKRYAEMRPPAFLWKSAAGRSPFDGFFRDLFAGDSLHRVSHWTQTAADGTAVTGVRLNPTGPNWIDIDQYGRIVRETRKLDNGDVIEVGRSLDDPTRWAPVPEYRDGGSYELSWRDTTSGTTGTRHVDGNGRWRDLFTDENGVERVRLRSEGRDTREYLFEAPSTRDLSLDDRAGTWVDRNSLLHVTGRRDLIDGRIVESSGSPYRTSWTWRAFSTDDPATAVADGLRKQNRGSFYSKTWDDSFVDLDRLGNVVRERNATDIGGSWIDAVKQSDGTWKWTRTAADGTVHSEGTRVYDGIAGGGRWRDLVENQVVRLRDAGGRVREFDYRIVAPERPTTLPTTPSLRDLISHSARQFEPPTTVRVNSQVWKEYDLGKVFRERVAVDGTPGRFREVDKQWGQWREFQDGHLVEQRTFTGRVWKTDAFGRLSTSGPAYVPEYLAGALPRIGDEVGLPGDTGWRVIGRETDFRGAEIEALGLLREVQDPWHGVLTGVKDGISAEMPVWQRELRGALLTFGTGFITEFTATLAITAATMGNGSVTPLDVYRALLNGAVGGTFNTGLNVLHNRTPLGYFKNSMGARDWGGHPKQSMNSNTDDWATDWAAQEKPTRWRNATYANTVGITTSALSGFVSNAISASVFGVNGNEVKGADALLAGLWGAGASAFIGVTTGLARNAFHLTTGARVFHKGGLPELGVTWSESVLARYINWLIAEQDRKNGNDLPAPGRLFPAQPTTTTTTATSSTTATQQPAAATAGSAGSAGSTATPVSPIEGSELL